MGHSVLVVDDKAALRYFTVLYLEQLVVDGCKLQVYEASDGRGALGIITQHAQQVTGIDLVISEIEMGNMTGFQLVDEARRIFPTTKYLLVSENMGAYEQQAKARGATTLARPFIESDLTGAVKSLFSLQNPPSP